MKKFYFNYFFNFMFNSKKNLSKKNFDFSKICTFEEFKLKLEEYSKKSPYPNIDN